MKRAQLATLKFQLPEELKECGSDRGGTIPVIVN